jgi:3-oxoacyl-[acyl-carrier protein] reductase
LATATMPLRKVAKAEDVAAAIVWASSPVAAAHISGQLITVAGGMEGRLLNDPYQRQPPDAPAMLRGGR